MKAREGRNAPEQEHPTPLPWRARRAAFEGPRAASALGGKGRLVDNQNGVQILNAILDLATGFVTFLGAFLIVWGAIKLGMAVREQQGGQAIGEAIATIGGGAIIVAAAMFFGNLDTDWVAGTGNLGA